MPDERRSGYHARVRRSTPSPLAIIVLAAIACLLALPFVAAGRGGASAEPATFDFAPYLRRSDGRPADPVNVIVVGQGDADAVADRLADVLRWVRVPGSDMAFVDRGQTRWANVQLGTAGEAGFRKHIRLAGGAAESPRWGAYTLASVHHDLVVPCGHVGLGFDEERDALAFAMRNAGYPLSWVYVGNDGPVEHCNGTESRGDGWAAVIDLRPSRTPTSTPTASPAPSPTPAPTPARSPEPIATPIPTPSPTPVPTGTPETPSPSDGPISPDYRG